MTESLKVDCETFPVIEEQAFVLKRKERTEGVRVHTVVRETQTVIDEPLATEEIRVDRTALDLWVDGPVPVRHEGDVTIVTLVEEVLVVEKRLRAVEEIRITKKRSVRREPQQVNLRREEAVIDRFRPAPDDETL